jgi:hypothetical protein
MMDDREVLNFRESTKAQRMAGVMSPSFLCRRCRQPRARAGRKELVKGCPKAGYICAKCFAEKSACTTSQL